jgi:hypothetical protein
VIDRRKIVPIGNGGHTYSVDGRGLVAVTTVIHTVLRAPQLEEWFKKVGANADAIRDEAAAFGKSIHAGLTAHVTGRKLLPLDMPLNWWSTLEAGIRWLDDNLEEVYAAEETIASLKYGYAGKPDLYARLLGHKTPCIIDYKTTAAVYPSHPMQLAAYRKAAVETYGDKAADRLILLFSKDEPGKVTVHHFKNHDRDFAAFGYCLGLYHILKQGV